MIKYFDLTAEEQKIEDAIGTKKWKSIPNVKKEIKRYQKIAHDTLAKNANINLRLSQKVLIKLKAKAAAMGLPYQTLASSILHRYALS